MAIKKTRQRQRGGPYSKFDKTKTLPREFQIVESGDPNSKDGRAVYIAFEAGEPKRLSTYEDMQEDIDNATEEIQGTLAAGVDKKIKEADAAITSAKSAATKANTATTNANKATDSANKAADNANKAVENIQSKVAINDKQPSDTTAYSGNKIEEIVENMQWIASAGYKSIAANTNLDSLSEKGIYFSIGSNITSTLSGKPSDLRYGFVMRVMEITNNKFFVQEIEENVTRKVYRRVSENGVYNKDWVTLLDTSDLVANLTTTVTGKVLDALMGKKLKDEIDALNSALKNQFNQNRVELTNSSYYPDVVVYRSGQSIYMKCAGTLDKEVPANAPYVVGIESMMPEEFRPNANIVAYPNISLGGKNIKVEILTSGRVVFTSPEKLPVGFGLNMHFTYMTGKSSF